MTDYNPPDDTEIATSKAIKATTGRRLRDMPIAIAEGSDGAPRVQGIALGGRLVGITNGTASTWDTFTGLDGVKVITVRGTALSLGSSGDIQIAFSDDNGSSWGSSQTIATILADNDAFTSFCATISLDNGASNVSGLRYSGSALDPLDGYKTFTIPSDANAIRVRSTAGGGLDCSILIEEGFD